MIRIPPVGIEVALHYHTRPGDIDEGNFTPAHKEWIDRFVELGLMVESLFLDQKYKATDGLGMYVEKLCSISPPSLCWSFKEGA